ncbi:MAG: DUF1254 domain-containing protein [Aquabacterium sp.]
MRSVNWRLHLPLALLLAAVVHLATIWAYPRVVMRAVLQGLVAMGTAPQPVYPAPTDHTQRRIVMPSPDLLYALCAYDLTAGPLTVTADPPVPGYWSVALYADNTDNFFVVHDRQAGRRPLRLMLLAPGAVPPAAGADGAEVVTAPAARGLLLMRLLADPTLPLPLLDAARRTLRCDQPAASR